MTGGMASNGPQDEGEAAQPGADERVDRRRVLTVAGMAALVAAGGGIYAYRSLDRGSGDAEDAKAPQGRGRLPSQAERDALAGIAVGVMRQFEVPALSIAIAHRGQLVYREAFGLADERRAERATPSSLFRIASVSKPLTSAAVFSLVDQGKLSLSDRVFGPGGHLSGFKEAPAAVQGITVHHLLTHTAGAWGNQTSDPMFEHPELDHAALIAWTLSNVPPIAPPGRQYAYSNFGYCLLGRVIEKASGQTYERYVREQVLAKCGITRMRVGGNRLAERAEDEVVYYGRDPGGATSYGMNVARMDAHGGWIATPSDLVTFATHVDGLSSVPDILSAKSIRAMTEPVEVSGNYACGWAVDEHRNWWHNGSLPGTSAQLMRTGRGLCWSALANFRAEGIDPALEDMMWRMARAVPGWKA